MCGHWNLGIWWYMYMFNPIPPKWRVDPMCFHGGFLKCYHEIGLYNSREPNLSGQQIYSHPLEFTPDSKPLQIQSNKLKLITQLNLSFSPRNNLWYSELQWENQQKNSGGSEVHPWNPMNIHDESPSSIPSLAGDVRSRFDATVINTKELQKLLNTDALPSFHPHRGGSP